MKIPPRYIRFFRTFQIDTRALAAMRIGLGLVLLYDIIDRSRLLDVYYTDSGVSPRPLFMSGPTRWQSLYALNGSLEWATTLFVLQGIFALLFAIGYQTRLVTAVLLVLCWSLINRNPTLSHGGQNLAVWLLAWGFFLPLGAVASVDALTARASRPIRRVCSIASAAILIQLALVYASAFACKTHADWRSNFLAIYYFVQSPIGTPLGSRLANWPELTQLMTMYSMALELVGALLALLTWKMPRTRTFIVLLFIMFHLGHAATVYVGTFPFICIAAWMLYLPRQTWDALARVHLTQWLARTWARLMSGIAAAIETLARYVPILARRSIGPVRIGPVSQIVVSLLLVHVLLVNALLELPRSITRFAGPINRLPKLKQNWAVMDVPWHQFPVLFIEVQLADGSKRVLKPDDADDGAFSKTITPVITREEYHRSLWPANHTPLIEYRMTLLMGGLEGSMPILEAFCDFHRRRWNASHPPSQQIASMKLNCVYTEILPPQPLSILPVKPRHGTTTLYSWNG